MKSFFRSVPVVALVAFTELSGCSSGTGPASTGGTGPGGMGGVPGSGGNSGAATGGAANDGGSGGTGGTQGPTRTYVYVGSGAWSGATGKVQAFELDEQTAALTPVQETTVGALNSFLAFHPTLPVLYAGDEVGNKLRAYSVEAATGKLTFLDEATTAGGPVYVNIDKTGKYALLAYYGAGAVEVFSLEASGAIGASVDSENTGQNAHSIVLDPSNTFAFVPNLGSNYVAQYAFDAATGQLTENTTPVMARPGGPRHLAFSKDGAHAYVVNEIARTVSTLAYASASGTLSDVETIPNAEAGAEGASADVHITPNGNYLYATNRAAAASTIGMYSIGTDGKLTSLGFESTHGSTPRNFAIHPNGKLLLVGNQESNNVASFRILDNGKLEFIGTTDVGAASFWVGFFVVPG